MTTRLIRRSTMWSAQAILGALRDVHGSRVVKSVAPANARSANSAFKQRELGVFAGHLLPSESLSKYFPITGYNRADLRRRSCSFAYALSGEVNRANHQISVTNFQRLRSERLASAMWDQWCSYNLTHINSDASGYRAEFRKQLCRRSPNDQVEVVSIARPLLPVSGVAAAVSVSAEGGKQTSLNRRYLDRATKITIMSATTPRSNNTGAKLRRGGCMCTYSSAMSLVNAFFCARICSINTHAWLFVSV